MIAYNVKTRFSLASNAIIFNEKNEVLLCHRRDQNKWNFPGGAIEAGETPIEAVIREAREEIGVEIAPLRLLGIYTKPNDDDQVFVFICKLLKGTPSLSDETDEIRYFSVDELPVNMSPMQIERIHDAIGGMTEILFKKQFRTPNV